jgi:hypothetical protein
MLQISVVQSCSKGYNGKDMDYDLTNNGIVSSVLQNNESN